MNKYTEIEIYKLNNKNKEKYEYINNYDNIIIISKIFNFIKKE